MKQIKIKNLKLINFKGVCDLEINQFDDQETFIYGDNKTGKTSTVDAFNWLLFGKDSFGRSDFEVKTLDEKGKVIEKIEHEVSATLTIDGTPLKLRRVLREKWVKKKGNTTPEFTGNETEYFWNDVPVQQKEYQSNISGLLDESLFKLITSVTAFNALKWDQRRSILSDMVTITQSEIVGENAAFIKLMEDVKGFKNIEDYKKAKNASIKKAKDELTMIPTRIDEVTRNKPEPKDFAALRIALTGKEKELANIDAQIEDKTKQTEGIIETQNAHALKVNGVKTKISTLQNSIKNESDKQVNDGKGDYNKLVAEINNTNQCLDLENTIHTNLVIKRDKTVKDIEAIVQQMADKRAAWSTENSKVFTFDESECKCPTCKRDFETSDIDTKKVEWLKNFNEAKEKALLKISNEGKALSDDKAKLEKTLEDYIKTITESAFKITEFNKDIVSLKEQAEAVKPNPEADEKKAEMIYETMLSNNPELIALNKELTELNEITSSFTTVAPIDNTQLKEQKAIVNMEINDIKVELLVEDEIKKADERIKQLTAEESTLAQQVADVEKDIMVADEYTKAKIDALETKINKKFMYVKFKMFDTQINGGESECCDATIDGVPFSDANTASRINAGLDIINTLTEHYGISAPIFIDNRESVVKILPVHSQLVNLVVSAGDKKLRVA